MRTSIPVQIALSLVVAGSSASAITIDNFEEGPFSVSAVSGSTDEDTQGSLSTLNVISGQRTVVVQSFLGVIPTTADLALTAGDDAAVLSGDPNSPNSGFSFEYAFASPFDLTMGGSLDRFIVDIAAASGSSSLLFGLVYGEAEDALDPGCCATGYSAQAPFPLTPGAITILFSDFFLAAVPREGEPALLDLTQVEELFMFGQAHGSLSVSNIAAIPEPSTALLVSFGVLAVAAGRRRLNGRSCCR